MATTARGVLPRDVLASTGLLVEATDCHPDDGRLTSYYGYNVTKSTREPVEQIHGFLAARALAEACGRSAAAFFPLIAGLFEVLNTKSHDELQRVAAEKRAREKHKERIFQRALELFGLDGQVLLTQDLWGHEHYWSVVDELVKSGRYSRKSLTEDTMRWFTSEDELNSYQSLGAVAPGLMNMTPAAIKRMGEWPAPIVYTPLEVAEARFLADEFDVRVKIGHMEETVYDKYIVNFMDIVHLRQPVDFSSRRVSPKTVTPYIDRIRRGKAELRVFYEDTEDEIADRVGQAVIDEYVFALSPKAGEVLNPVLDKLVLAAESARWWGHPLELAGGRVTTGAELIHLAARRELSISELAENLPRVAYRYLVEPYGVAGTASSGAAE